jgi:hypothetical protein
MMRRSMGGSPPDLPTCLAQALDPWLAVKEFGTDAGKRARKARQGQ